MITVNVHSFSLGDVDDPEIYAGQHLYEWEKSEVGQWVMKNALETPTWNIMAHPYHYGHQCVIRARMSEENATYFMLKWNKTDANSNRSF